MKDILLLTKTNLKRNFLAILLSIIGGLILCFLISAMGNLASGNELKSIQLGIIDSDKSDLSKDFKDYLTKDMKYGLVENKTYDNLSRELIDRNISAIIEIPENFQGLFTAGEVPKLIVTTLDDYENAAFLQANLDGYMGSIRMISVGAANDTTMFTQLLKKARTQEIKVSAAAAIEIDRTTFSQKEGFINSIGFYLMFIFGISILLSFMVLDDRLSGVFNRIQITPVKPIQYIIGTAVFGLIMCVVEIVIYCGYVYINHINIGFPLWILVMFMSLFSLFTVCFSLAVALALKSKNAITSAVIGFSTIGCILGGAYFPISMSPESLQTLARVLPQFWFMDALRALQTNVNTNILPNVIVLSLFVVLSFLIGAVLFSQQYKNS